MKNRSIAAEFADLRFRTSLQAGEPRIIRELTDSVAVFHDYEVEIAGELADENLSKGPEASGYHFLLAERQGEIVGFTCFGEIPCTRGRYDLYWIVVKKDFQGKGLGRELLRRTEEAIEARGGRKLYVETSSQEAYLATRRFYERCGYLEIGRFPDFYEDGDAKVTYCRDLI
ncbi:MAG: GNAT family N-acetyltransferase [Negativicutes bacterium]|nr:GNAT family N-acetyltransferase [Negativicutes bacterium]